MKPRKTFTGIEVFMAMKIHVVVLRVMTMCTVLGSYQCFGGTYCLHVQSIKRLHDAITQNTAQQASKQ
jgi:hypothetical protein